MEKYKNTIRIAHIVGKWVGGGVEAVVMNYYLHTDKKSFQFDFICDEDSTNIPYKEIESLGGKVILIPSYSKVFKYQKELKKILKENNYKIIHSHINTMSVFPLRAAKKAGVPIRIAHSHSTTNKAEWKKNLLKQVLRPFSKTYATHYFACTEHAGRWLFGNNSFNKGKVFLINNAIDLNKFKYDERIRNIKRKELGIKDNEIVIGHIGRFVKQKNHKLLIDIFNEIHKTNNDFVLLLAGQGPLQEEVVKKVEELELKEYVKFLGQREDVNELYQAFDIFLLPSLYEGLGMVLIEAQCAGLLCFASTDVPAIAKVTENLRFISSSTDLQLYSKVIIESIMNFKRKDNSYEVLKNGFDINFEKNKLEKYYFNLLLECE